jgi:hypothetical protein
MKVTVETAEDLGAEHHLMFSVASPAVRTDATRDASDGDEATLLRTEGSSLMTARLHGPQRVSVGETVTLAVDNGAFHLFDLESGAVLASPVDQVGSYSNGALGASPGLLTNAIASTP